MVKYRFRLEDEINCLNGLTGLAWSETEDEKNLVACRGFSRFNIAIDTSGTRCLYTPTVWVLTNEYKLPPANDIISICDTLLTWGMGYYAGIQCMKNQIDVIQEKARKLLE